MSEHEIIALLAKRNELALAEITRQYKGLCFSIFKNVGLNDAACDECMNDLLLQIWSVKEPQNIGSLRHYIGQIARNIAIDSIKHDARMKRGAGITVEPLEEMEDFVSLDDAESVLENDALARALNGFLRMLPEKERNLFIRRYFFLDSTSALEKRFGMHKGAILRQLSRTRKKLKITLEKEGFTL